MRVTSSANANNNNLILDDSWWCLENNGNNIWELSLLLKGYGSFEIFQLSRKIEMNLKRFEETFWAKKWAKYKKVCCKVMEGHVGSFL